MTWYNEGTPAHVTRGKRVGKKIVRRQGATMKLKKADARDKKRRKRKHGMRISGKGYVHVINRLRKKKRKKNASN